MTAKEKRVAYHGFTADELGAERLFCGYESFNCDCRGGRLTTAVGASFVKDAFGTEIKMSGSITVKRFFQGVLKTETGDLEKVYFLVGETGSVSMFQSGKGWLVMDSIAPIACIVTREENGGVWNVLLADTGVYVVKKFGVLEKRLEMECVAGCCVGERVFYGCKNGEIVYSKPCDPTFVLENVDDSGKLFLPADAGEIMAMKGLGKAVYVFCERAVYKLSVRARASEFVLTRIPYAGGRIVRNGVGVVGESIVVLAEDGAYVLKNDGIERAYEKLNFGRIASEYGAEYGCFEGKITFVYYERGRVASTKKCVTLYDDGKCGFFGDAYNGLSGGESGVFFTKANMLACVGGVLDMFGTAPIFRARTTDFGVAEKKTLKKMRLYGTGETKVTVQSEQGQHTYALAFRNGVAETRLTGSGFAFTFTFQPKLGCVLDGADVEFLYAEE